MKNYIIKVDNEEQSELVQIKILGKGYIWSEGFNRIQYKDKPVLIFDNLNNKERSISYHETVMSEEYRKWSCYQKHTKIDAADFLALERF